MFKKLRLKFLWGSTLVLLLVIALVVGIIYWATSHTITQQTQVFIDLILGNDGILPEQNAFDPRQQTFLALNDESIHEARYFSVRFSGENESLVSIRIAALSEEGAIDLAKRVIGRESETGRISAPGGHILQYARQADEDGSTLVVIVDATSRYGLMRLIMTYMASLWCFVLLLYVLLMIHYSKKLVQPFVENDERQKRFITNASHELKTPLAVISANNEMMEAVSGKAKWTESTGRQVKRLQSLIEDLVVLTRLDEMAEIALTRIDCSALVLETAESFRDVIEASGKTYHCEIEPDIHVQGEKRAIQQLTSILLDNAAKYCDEGGTITVKLSRKSKGKEAVCSISNTYAAGANEDTSHFFERFYRQDESHSSEKTGFGIGLSMAKEITERLKGRIRVSYSNQTIYFIFELTV